MGHNGCVHVAIVDDEAIFRDAARQWLTARGYRVVAEAGCAASAVEAVQRHEPDACWSTSILATTTASRSVTP